MVWTLTVAQNVIIPCMQHTQTMFTHCLTCMYANIKSNSVLPTSIKDYPHRRQWKPFCFSSIASVERGRPSCHTRAGQSWQMARIDPAEWQPPPRHNSDSSAAIDNKATHRTGQRFIYYTYLQQATHFISAFHSHNIKPPLRDIKHVLASSSASEIPAPAPSDTKPR